MGNCWDSPAAAAAAADALPQTHSSSSSSTKTPRRRPRPPLSSGTLTTTSSSSSTKAPRRPPPPSLSSGTLTTTSSSSSGPNNAPSSYSRGSSNFFSSSSSSSAAAASSSSGNDGAFFPPNGGGHILASPNLRIFTLSQLKAATRNFRPDTLLGEGGFGKVFKGWLLDDHDKVPIAVKKLNSESMQGFEEWLAEVNFLGSLSHPNLVRLLGYCFEDDELLLVYEFMQKGSLENHLFGRGSAGQPLPWEIRFKIAIGAARGLAFLHTSDKQVIYRDFKASNILLDGSYTPKISDFGLAKLGPSASQSHLTTRVMGTNGYAAPEYIATGHLYVKSDVYGFGVVLIEILTGLRTLDPTRPSGKQKLVDWIKPYLSNKRKLKNAMDSRLEGKYPAKTALQIARLALNCIEAEPKDRPSMREVVETLECIEAPKESPSEPGRNRPMPHRRGQVPLQYGSPLHPIPKPDVIRDQRSAQLR